MTDSGYFVGQVADLLGGGKKKKKAEQLKPPDTQLATLFNVKTKASDSSTTKPKKPKHAKKHKTSNTESEHTLSEKNSKTNGSTLPKTKKVKHAEKHKNIQTESKPKPADVKAKKSESPVLKTRKSKKARKLKNIQAESDAGPRSDSEKPRKLKTKSKVFENVPPEKSTPEAQTIKKKKGNDGFCPPKGIVHESLMKKTSTEKKETSKRKLEEGSDDENEETPKKRRKKHKRDKTKDKRTVFVGNLPIDCKKSTVKTLFAEFGKIESLRFRCPPVSDPKVSKKVTAIKKEFHPDRSNIVSFICYEELSAAQTALKLNGHDLNGFHLRVDLASNEKKHNKTNSVFIGNLAYDIEENDVWNHFEPCGGIENVRIVRDRKTGLGKGFGYVLFEEKSSIDLAQKLNLSKLKGRNIRVDKCLDSKRETIVKNHPARQRLIKKNKKLGLKPTNMRPGEQRKPKSLKKKDKGKKSKTKDSVDKAFAAPRPMPHTNKHVKFD